jgi:hypothetical protein
MRAAAGKHPLLRLELDGEGLASRHEDEPAHRELGGLEEQLERLASGLAPEKVKWIEQDAIRSSWFGLARYWRKKLAPPPAPAPPNPPAPAA